MRVAIVSECFLPVINGVTNSVLRVVEHLTAARHEVLVIAPGLEGPTEYEGARVVRIPAVDLPMVSSMPVGVPSRRVLTALREFVPDVVHLAAPFVVGLPGGWRPPAGWASRPWRSTRPTWPGSPRPTGWG